MKTIKIILQKISLAIALVVELPLCALAFFLDAIIGGIFVIVRLIIQDRKGANNSAELMFEVAGFFLMIAIVTFSALINTEYIC